jgi:hypothetical protein
VDWAVGGFGECEDEKFRITSWRNLTKALMDGSVSVPCTASLVALHNMVTKSVPEEYMAASRRSYHCPQDVVQGLKSSAIFSSAAEVQNFTLPSFTPVPGVPGLDTQNDLLSCSR